MKTIKEAALDYVGMNDDKQANSSKSFTKFDMLETYLAGAEFVQKAITGQPQMKCTTAEKLGIIDRCPNHEEVSMVAVKRYKAGEEYKELKSRQLSSAISWEIITLDEPDRVRILEATLQLIQSVKAMTEIEQPTIIDKIKQWGIDRNIHTQDPRIQMCKVMEEIGELAKAINKSDKTGQEDSIGDSMTTLIMVALQCGLDPTKCLEYAYNEIKDRKGMMINGMFVKESDYLLLESKI